MTVALRGLLLAICFVALAPSVTAQLVDLGPNGEYFQDTSTGLYWYDPAQFVGMTRAAIDAFVTSSTTWQWATGAQVDVLNGKSAPAGMNLESVMGARQFSLTNNGPRWIGYHASASNPDGWIAQSFNSAGFTTIDATGWQFNVLSWGPGAWIVSTSPPTPANSLSVGQPGGAGSLLIQFSGPANANYFLAYSFDALNASSPGTGYWQGLHISLLTLGQQATSGAAPNIGTLDANGSDTFSVPAGTLAPLPTVYAVATYFDATWTTQLGATAIESLTIN